MYKNKLKYSQIPLKIDLRNFWSLLDWTWRWFYLCYVLDILLYICMLSFILYVIYLLFKLIMFIFWSPILNTLLILYLSEQKYRML